MKTPAKMRRPENGTYIVMGEINLLVTAMRRSGSRWSHSHHNDESDPLINSFIQLKDVLNSITGLDEMAPNEFLGPFLEVIRSEDTTGPITGLALTSINKFLAYVLIDETCDTAAAAIENIADAVTHARFVGTDPNADEVVLMKILHVLRTLMLTSAGSMLTNESVCEIMQSCFRICFEMRLSELLRKSAENILTDMVQLLFSRLPQFKEDHTWASTIIKRMRMMKGSGIDSTASRKGKKKSPKVKHKKMADQPSETDTTPAEKESESKNTAGSSETTTSHDPSQPMNVSISVPDGGHEATGLEVGATEEGRATGRGGVDEDPEEILEKIEVIATTPVAGNKTVVDIQKDFQGASDSEAAERLGTPHDVICDVIDQYSDKKQRERSLTETDKSSAPVNANLEQVTKSHRRTISISDGASFLGGGTSDGAEPVKISLHVDNTDSAEVEKREADDSQTHCDKTQESSLDGDSSVVSSEHAHSPQQQSGHSDHVGSEYVNPRGVRFMPHMPHEAGPLLPYGLPCVRELFRFLVSLTNPLDRHNSDVMIHMGLSLLTVALESGADYIPRYSSLMCLVKDDMCKNLIFLLQSDRHTLFAASIRVCFLLFEAMRSALKLQLEMYISKLMEIVVSWTGSSSEEKREMALESIVQILRIPGLVTELYLNYDCDLYCSNLFEDLMKLLSKNAFPVSGLVDSVHLLSLDALLAVIDSIETHCHHRILQGASQANTQAEDPLAGGTPREGIPIATAPVPPSSGYSTGQQHLASTIPLPPPAPAPPQSSGPPGGGACWERLPSPTHRGAAAARVVAHPRIRPNRMKPAQSVPTAEQLAAVKHKKRLYTAGTEQFNVKPAKGIALLQEHGLLRTPLDPDEVAAMLRENPRLDKKQIGEYISDKRHAQIMMAFLRSFVFEDRRVDETLRMFLETFRLAGEAPVISYILEHFAEHYQACNHNPFANADACFTLAYAVIMLNVDQHNTNAKKQNIPMTLQEFKKNVKGCNGGGDFDQDMLEEIYTAVKTDEIVMPAEQTGVVKENYMWKVLLKRGNGREGLFIHAPTGSFDRDLFSLVWGPTVAALSFVFDKSSEEVIVHKAASGFRKCAMISAHYAMSDVFDNLVISLCKFTTLLSAPDNSEQIAPLFGSNPKAKLAAKTVFGLAHRHGDILREGWKNILDCLLSLYRAKLLPEVLIRVEDFLDPKGSISLMREEAPTMTKNDSGVFSSFYSFLSLSDTPPQRGPSPEEQEATRQARACLEDCHLEQLVQESKFLRTASLQELLKALMQASRWPPEEQDNGNSDQDYAIFFFELLVKVVLQNRDRVAPFWQSLREHIYNLVVNASEYSRLVERAVVGLLRIAIRLLRREEIAPQVLSSLRMLLLMKPAVIHSVCQQVSYGLHDLLKTNAANIHSWHDWCTLFTLLEVVGAGVMPPPIMQAGSGVSSVRDSLKDAGAASDSEAVGSGTGSTETDTSRGYTSDSELYENNRQNKSQAASSQLQAAGSWHMVNKDEVSGAPSSPLATVSTSNPLLATAGAGRKSSSATAVNQYTIAWSERPTHHDSKALVKSCETLVFLVRDAAHVTPHNFHSCVHCLRTFVEASVNGGVQARQQKQKEQAARQSRKNASRVRKHGRLGISKSKTSPNHLQHLSDSEEEKDMDSFHSMCIQLLDLMHTLHTRAATIFGSWAAEQGQSHQLNTQGSEGAGVPTPTPTGPAPAVEGQGTMLPPGGVEEEMCIEANASSLWLKCWCPLLQGIARLCCDGRRQVRSQALTYLQRALLVHDLQTLSPAEWENCFNKVLFPLLHLLLETIDGSDPSGVEETRMRASTLLCKVFLQHLTPLLSLSTFTALWLTILDFMDKYMHADRSDLLVEAVPESLKNMLLVMHTAGILSPEPEQAQLWSMTWERIDVFLPTLKQELFKPHETEPQKNVIDREPTPTPDHTRAQTPPIDVSQPPPRKQSANQKSPRQQPANQTADGRNQSPTQFSSSPVGGGASVGARPHSPLTTPPSPGPAPSSSLPYILHPPLPAVSSPGQQHTTSVPLILNPDLIAQTIPIMQNQKPAEKPPTTSTFPSQCVVKDY